MRLPLLSLALSLMMAGWGCTTSPAAAAAAPDAVTPTTLQAVQALLAAEEHVATLDELTRISPEVPTLLMRLAQDHEQDIAYRARAVSYLGYYRDNQTVEHFLTNLVTTPDPPSPLLRRGLRALARVAKGNAVHTISPHLHAKEPLIREAAAQALVETEDPTAWQALERAAASEPESYLRKKLHEMATEHQRRNQQPPQLDQPHHQSGVQSGVQSDVQSTQY